MEGEEVVVEDSEGEIEVALGVVEVGEVVEAVEEDLVTGLVAFLAVETQTLGGEMLATSARLLEKVVEVVGVVVVEAVVEEVGVEIVMGEEVIEDMGEEVAGVETMIEAMTEIEVETGMEEGMVMEEGEVGVPCTGVVGMNAPDLTDAFTHSDWILFKRKIKVVNVHFD